LAPPPPARDFLPVTRLIRRRAALLRAGLALWLAVATLWSPPARLAGPLVDPFLAAALAAALAAGALCQVNGVAGQVPGVPGPGHSHEHCAACLGSAPPAKLPALVALPRPWPGTTAGSVPARAVPVLAGFRPAYASRAPPGAIG